MESGSNKKPAQRESPLEELIHSAEANGRGRGVHCDLRDRPVLAGRSSRVIIGGGAAGTSSVGDWEVWFSIQKASLIEAVIRVVGAWTKENATNLDGNCEGNEGKQQAKNT